MNTKYNLVTIFGLSISLVGLIILFYLYISLDYFLKAARHIQVFAMFLACFAMMLNLIGGGLCLYIIDKDEKEHVS